MSVQGDYNNILRCTFVLYQSLEAAINEKQPILCSSLITSSICTNPFGALDHTYPELSVARATLVVKGEAFIDERSRPVDADGKKRDSLEFFVLL